MKKAQHIDFDDKDLYVSLVTPKGVEYVIDGTGNVLGPGGITKKRIEWHVFLAGLKYKGPGSGYPILFIVNEFSDAKWIKVTGYRVETEEEAEMVARGELIY